MRNNSILFKLFIIFVIQWCMIVITIQYYVWNDEAEGGWYPHRYPPPTFSIGLLKYICVITLHLIMQPRVCDPIERLRYVIHHPERFEQIFIPQLICWMKIASEVGIECVLIVSTAYENDAVWMVMDFTALMVIYYIDSSYFESIKDPLKDKLIHEQNLELPIINSMEDFPLKDLPWREKIYNIIMKTWWFLYETVYFHFLPYIAMYYAYFGLWCLQDCSTE